MLLCIGLVCSSYATPEMSVTGKHFDNGVTCVDCHDTDNPVKKASVSACSTCHGEYADVAELTASMEINPHASHQGEVRCTLCHKTHEPSVLMCNNCHEFEMAVK